MEDKQAPAFSQLNRINGEWRKPVEVETGLMDVVQSVQAGNQAFNELAAKKDGDISTIESRVIWLRAIAQELDLTSAAMAERIYTGDRIPVGILTQSQIPRARNYFLAAAEHLELMKPEVSTGRSIRSRGLVAIITPAQDAMSEISMRVASAIASGSPVILKPSSDSHAVARELVDLISRVGIELNWPKGMIGCLFGKGSDVGQYLAQHPGISTITISGQRSTVSSVLKTAADLIKRVHFVCSARNPMIVFAKDISNIPEIAQCLWSINSLPSFRASRLFIHEPVYREVLEQLRLQMSQLAIESIGPILKPAEHGIYLKARRLAETERGKNLSEQSPTEPVANPYLSYDLSLCSNLQQDEMTGPFVAATSFKYQHEAINKMANVSPWGMAAYIIDEDLERAKKISSKLDAGLVFINGRTRGDDMFWAKTTFTPQKASGNSALGIKPLIEFFSVQNRFYLT
jgi:5-carboxymethyl-2-hydroxymuconic-semialdehyde dehydrogenase